MSLVTHLTHCVGYFLFLIKIAKICLIRSFPDIITEKFKEQNKLLRTNVENANLFTKMEKKKVKEKGGVLSFVYLIIILFH